MKISNKSMRRNFLKYSCSGALLYVFNREFGNEMPSLEIAASPLGGGMMQNGRQCGMLWGASLGSGAEVFRRYKDGPVAISLSMEATRRLLDSYHKRTKTHNCREVTGCNPSTRAGLIKYFILGKPLFCMNLGTKWAPEALEVTKPILENPKSAPSAKCMSCASELAKKMGAKDEEVIMVSGFAGGLGLSGNLCGALTAAIWLMCHERVKAGKSMFSIPETKILQQKFLQHTKGELLCRNITGRKFSSLEEHSDFLNEGGCEDILNVLSANK